MEHHSSSGPGSDREGVSDVTSSIYSSYNKVLTDASMQDIFEDAPDTTPRPHSPSITRQQVARRNTSAPAVDSKSLDPLDAPNPYAFLAVIGDGTVESREEAAQAVEHSVDDNTATKLASLASYRISVAPMDDVDLNEGRYQDFFKHLCMMDLVMH